MRVIASFVGAFPWQSLGVLLALRVAGVLEGVNAAPPRLAIPAGACIAVIGHSGSGKMTIVDLAIGLLRPQRARGWPDDTQRVDAADRLYRLEKGEAILVADGCGPGAPPAAAARRG